MFRDHFALLSRFNNLQHVVWHPRLTRITTDRFFSRTQGLYLDLHMLMCRSRGGVAVDFSAWDLRFAMLVNNVLMHFAGRVKWACLCHLQRGSQGIHESFLELPYAACECTLAARDNADLETAMADFFVLAGAKVDKWGTWGLALEWNSYQ